MNCPKCSGLLRHTQIHAAGARSEGGDLPKGSLAWVCEDCQARFIENADGELTKVP